MRIPGRKKIAAFFAKSAVGRDAVELNDKQITLVQEILTYMNARGTPLALDAMTKNDVVHFYAALFKYHEPLSNGRYIASQSQAVAIGASQAQKLGFGGVGRKAIADGGRKKKTLPPAVKGRAARAARASTSGIKEVKGKKAARILRDTGARSAEMISMQTEALLSLFNSKRTFTDRQRFQILCTNRNIQILLQLGESYMSDADVRESRANARATASVNRAVNGRKKAPEKILFKDLLGLSREYAGYSAGTF